MAKEGQSSKGKGKDKARAKGKGERKSKAKGKPKAEGPQPGEEEGASTPRPGALAVGVAAAAMPVVAVPTWGGPGGGAAWWVARNVAPGGLEVYVPAAPAGAPAAAASAFTFTCQVVGRPADSGARLDYVAQSKMRGELLAPEAAAQTMMAVVNRARGTATLVPCLGSGHPLRLQPRLRAPRGPPDTPRPAQEGAALAAQRQQLTREFGSQRAKRKLEQREKLKIDVKKVQFSEALQEVVVQEVRRQAADLSQQGIRAEVLANQLQVLPPCDLDATTAAAAYPIERMLPDRAWELLNPCTDALLALAGGGEPAAESLGPGVLQLRDTANVLAETVGQAEGETVRRGLAKYLALASMLLPLLAGKPTFSAASTSALAEQLGVPDLVLEALLPQFLTPTRASKGNMRWERTEDQRRRASNYILALVYAAHSHATMKLPTLVALLQRPKKDLVGDLRYMGFTVSGNKVTLLAPAPGLAAGAAPATLRDRLPGVKNLMPKDGKGPRGR